MQTSTLIDDIYEAAVLPERWGRVLDSLAAIADGEGTLLFVDAPGAVQYICSPAISQLIAEWVSSEWVARNTRGQRLIPIREPRFLTDLDAFTHAELERDPYYVEFLRPRGLGWCVGTSIRSPMGDTLVFSVEKLYRKGPVPREVAATLDGFRPHLARAALLSARIGLARARASVEALETIGFAAAVLSRDGRAVAANTHFLEYAPTIMLGPREEVRLANAAAQAIFAEALQALAVASGSYTGRSIPLASGGRAPMVVHLLPLRREARDIFSGAFCLLLVTSVVARKAPQPALLEVLFDLTPAEAKVASLLASDRSVAAIAQRQGVAENTVRMHLKSIFAKTGVHRQAQLVNLLSFPVAQSGTLATASA